MVQINLYFFTMTLKIEINFIAFKNDQEIIFVMTSIDEHIIKL